MSNDDQFIQKQINVLQVQIAALEMVVNSATVSVGKNAGLLEHLGKQHIEMRDKLLDLERTQLTKKDISDLLDVSVNAAIVSGFKKLGWALILSAIGVVVAIFTTPIHIK